jgi:hypothetical protein
VIREVDPRLIQPKFSVEDAMRAGETWGANCGPAALAVVAGMTLDEIRPYMGDFESKRHTNPTLMLACIRNLELPIGDWHLDNSGASLAWPKHGLARIQWEGPWTKPGVPIAARYRHTHWVASMAIEGEEQNIFDVNCMSVGGWVPLSEWAGSVVPWLLGQCEPKADGRWHITHCIEIERDPNEVLHA